MQTADTTVAGTLAGHRVILDRPGFALEFSAKLRYGQMTTPDTMKNIKHRVMSATEFKAKCLAVFEEMDDRGGSVTITKRGRPIAIVGPAKKDSWKSPRGMWVGKVHITGDIVNADTSELWDVVSRK